MANKHSSSGFMFRDYTTGNLWRKMLAHESCVGATKAGAVGETEQGRLLNRPQVTNLPHTEWLANTILLVLSDAVVQR